jgi:hypothetical protein
MACKNISLEIDTCDRLKSSRRPSESFSEIVCRITLPLPPAKTIAADLKRVVGSGKFARGIDWPAVKRIDSSRSRSRGTRTAV